MNKYALQKEIERNRNDISVLEAELRLILLEESLVVWSRPEGNTTGSYGCPLCREYINDGCRGCPVYKKTGLDACEETPYDEWQEIGHDFPEDFTPEEFEEKERVRKEMYNFLYELKEDEIEKIKILKEIVEK